MKKELRDFESSRKFARKLGLGSYTEWRKYCKSGKLPKDVSTVPDRTYKNKGWMGWGDFLGTGRVANFNKKWRDFESTREFVHSLNLKSTTEWQRYCKSMEKPKDIPAAPNIVYKNKGWKGFGDFLGTGRIREYLPFEEARKIVQELGITSSTKWREYYKSGKKPGNIPAAPDVIYKNKGWRGYSDFLGTGRIREYLPFEEARKIVHSMKLTGMNQYRELSKTNKLPKNIPATPNTVYKNKGWKGFGDWFGTGTISTHKISEKFLSFDKLKIKMKELAKKYNIKNDADWRRFIASGNKPDNIPSNLNQVYSKEWRGLGDLLGTGTIAPRNREYLSFKDAREFIRSLNLKNQKEWSEYCKSGEKPNDIPGHPDGIYKNEGWKSLGDWLGTGTIAPRNREYRSFKDAREFIRSLNLKNYKEWKEYCKSGEKPDDIPSHPHVIYKKRSKDDKLPNI